MKYVVNDPLSKWECSKSRSTLQTVLQNRIKSGDHKSLQRVIPLKYSIGFRSTCFSPSSRDMDIFGYSVSTVIFLNTPHLHPAQHPYIEFLVIYDII